MGNFTSALLGKIRAALTQASFFNLGSLISAITVDFVDLGKAVGEFVENEGCSVTILNTRPMDLRLKKHTQLGKHGDAGTGGAMGGKHLSPRIPTRLIPTPSIGNHVLEC